VCDLAKSKWKTFGASRIRQTCPKLIHRWVDGRGLPDVRELWGLVRPPKPRAYPLLLATDRRGEALVADFRFSRCKHDGRV